MELQTQAHLRSIHQWLVYRQHDLQTEVRAASDARRGDEADARQRLLGEDVQLARDLAWLQDVEDALGRLEAGTYGDCASCGDSIPAARLYASCQAAAEKRR